MQNEGILVIQVRMYAKAFFEDLAFDSVTVAPYMGKDSVEPFLSFKDKAYHFVGINIKRWSLRFSNT